MNDDDENEIAAGFEHLPKTYLFYNLSNDFGLVSNSRVKRQVIFAAFSSALE